MPCPVCASDDHASILTLPSVPVLCNQLWSTPEEARLADCGDVVLHYCRDCAFIWNAAFEPDRMVYATGYENALHHSKTFQDYAEGLAKNLVETYALQGKHVIEIGCGDGHFLSLMARYGAASAIGFDPSMAGRDSDFFDGEKVKIVPEYFSELHFDRHFDFVICRHVLEHLEDPLALLRAVKTATADRSVPVYFEVPNAEWMLSTVSLWDVIYEHVGYWSPTSLSNVFRRAGFRLLSVRTGYNDQFLMIEAAPGDDSEAASNLGGIERLAADFKTQANLAIQDWERRLDETRPVVIWGAGSKGITFANVLSAAGKNAFEALVDLNPQKHDRFIPGIGIAVVAPQELVELRPEIVLIANRLYLSEITQTLRDLGLTSTTMTVSG